MYYLLFDEARRLPDGFAPGGRDAGQP